MAFSPFEVNAVHLAYAFLAGFVVIFSLFSLVIKEKLYIGEAPIATVVGIIIGPHALKLFNPPDWGGGHQTVTDDITLEVTRVVIAIGVFAVGVELPKAYMKRHWRSLSFLLGPCMVYGWMISALLIWAMIPKLNFLSSLAIAACVTPTDPILAQAVVGGKFADKHVPAHIRHLLSAESGSNDGAAFPFLYIAIYLIIDRSTGEAVGQWFYITWIYEVVLGILLGAILGFCARKTMKFCEEKKFIDRQSYVAQYVSLAVLSIGITTLLGSDDLLAAFACGTAFAWDGFFNKATEDAVFSNVIDLLFNCAAFIYIGAIIPFGKFQDATISLSVWRLVVLAILILLIRRIPAILALYKFIPDIKTFREALFVGWFGPMGVGAIFISTLARTKLPEPSGEGELSQADLLYETIGPIVAFLVLASVLMHGLSIPFFSLSRRVHSITYTWSRNPSMDASRGDEPAWTSHARRIQPGQAITINRDDDPEEGDLGMRRTHTITSMEEPVNEKERQGGSSGGSSSSNTMAVGENIEMSEKKREGSGSSGPAADEEAIADDEEEAEDDENGRDTPPLAQYREGHHLVIERKGGEGEEVQVEVIRNHFHDAKPSERTSFTHPHALKHKEVDKLVEHLPKSVDHAVSHVVDGGSGAIDKMGLGLMTSNLSEEGSVASASSPRAPVSDIQSEEEGLREDPRTGEEQEENESEEDGYDEEQPADSEPRIHSRIPAIRLSKNAKKKKSLSQRLFGRRKSSARASSLSPSAVEEGRGMPDPNLLAPPRPYRGRSSSAVDEDSITNLNRTRTSSPPRSTAIRFAEALSPSSDTAPGVNAYASNTGFKRNPSLAMYRSTSVQSESSAKNAEGPSVSFREPEKPK
ncbi:sodium/hydrogen antiporter, partial [Tremellales sp. Uapishka_1]